MQATQTKEELLARHYFGFNKHDNGGEAFSLTTRLWNKNGSFYRDQEFCLNSYCNSASFILNGETISTDQLRTLANQLDKKMSTFHARVASKGNIDKKLGEHLFTFNLQPGGGNTLSLLTEYFDNGDGVPEGVYINQRLIMKSYGHQAVITLCGASIESDSLRRLANELDAVMAPYTGDE